MPIIHRNAHVAYSPHDLFAVVNDVDHYSDFLPWCPSSRVLSRNRDEVRAELEIAKGGFHKSFTVLYRLQQDKMIEVRLVEGPFRRLEGFWRFEAQAGDDCKVSFDLEYEFSSRMIGLVAGPIFSQAADSLLDAFVARSRQIYGRR